MSSHAFVAVQRPVVEVCAFRGDAKLSAPTPNGQG